MSEPRTVRSEAERLVRVMTDWLADDPKTRFEVVDDAYRSLRDVLASEVPKSGGDLAGVLEEALRHALKLAHSPIECEDFLRAAVARLDAAKQGHKPGGNGPGEYSAQDANAILHWVRDRLYPYVMREAGPKGKVPVERMVELITRAFDAGAERIKYLTSVAPPLCPSCGCIREHQPCDVNGAITGCLDTFHRQAPPCTCGAPNGWRHMDGCPWADPQSSEDSK